MATDLKEGVTMSKKIVRADNWDGKSRPSNKAYDESWHRIFGSNPVAKEVRTPKFKSQVVKSKKVYDRKKQTRRINFFNVMAMKWWQVELQVKL